MSGSTEKGPDFTARYIIVHIHLYWQSKPRRIALISVLQLWKLTSKVVLIFQNNVVQNTYYPVGTQLDCSLVLLGHSHSPSTSQGLLSVVSTSPRPPSQSRAHKSWQGWNDRIKWRNMPTWLPINARWTECARTGRRPAQTPGSIFLRPALHRELREGGGRGGIAISGWRGSPGSQEW